MRNVKSVRGMEWSQSTHKTFKKEVYEPHEIWYNGEMTVTVYTNPNCIQCDMTKKKMDQLGIQYSTIDLSTDQESLDKVLEMGYRSAPVVIAGEESWAGFQPEKIDQLAS